MATLTSTTGFKFKEVAGNNGAIANGLTFKITGGTFAGDNGDAVAATLTNKPDGLTAVLVKTSATTARLTFKGTADAHVTDVTNLKVVFGTTAFATGYTADLTADNLTIDFAAAAAVKALTLVPPVGADTGGIYKATTLPEVEGTAPDGVTKVYIYNNGGTKPIGEAAVTANAWSFKLPTEKLKDGEYSLTASASNDGKGAMTAGFGFTVDTKAPAAPSVNAIKGAISDTTPVLSGKAEKGATVKVFADEAQTKSLGTTTADDKGVWTLAVDNTVLAAGDATYKITALATDAAGNETKTKKSVDLIIDTTINTPTLTATTVAKKNTVTLSGKVEGETGGTLQLYGGEDGSLALGKAIKIGKDGTWKSSVKLTDGTHELSVIATDAAGNVSDNSVVNAATTVKIDTFTATPTLELVKSGEVLTGLKGTAEAGAKLKITIGAEKDKFTVDVGTDGTWTQSLAGFTPAKLGKLKITAIATDGATNVSKASTAVEHTFAAAAPDTTAPTFVSAATNAGGTEIILTYSEALHATTAAKTDFVVTTGVGNTANVVTGVAVTGSTVKLTLTTTLTEGTTNIKVGYTAPTVVAAATNAAIQDSAGNDAATLVSTTVTNSVGAAADTTAPTISAFSVATATTLSVTSSETGTAGLYNDTGNALITGTDGAVTAATAKTITVAAQGSMTTASLKVADAVPNTATSTTKVLLGTAGGDGGADFTVGAGDQYIFTFAGNDTVTLTSAAASGRVIADFTAGGDKIALTGTAFADITDNAGLLQAADFSSGAGKVVAATATEFIIYNSTTGDLYYDAGGNAGAAAVLIANLVGTPTLAATDFLFV